MDETYGASGNDDPVGGTDAGNLHRMPMWPLCRKKRRRSALPDDVSVRVRGVGYWRGIALHERDRRHRNEALNTLLEFGSLFLRLDRFANPNPIDESLNFILDEASFEVAPGSVVAFVDIGGAARMALTRIVGGALRPLRGSVCWRGRKACFSQFMAAPLSHRSVKENLQNLASIIGAQKEQAATAIERLRTESDHGRFLDMPLRRLPRQVFTDLGVHLLCLLELDCIAADEAMRPRSDRTAEVWWEYVRATPGSGRVVFLSSRRLEAIVDVATHLALIDGGNILFYGPTQEARQSFGDFLDTAISAPFTADEFAAAAEDLDDEEDDSEDESGAFGYDVEERKEPTSGRPDVDERKPSPSERHRRPTEQLAAQVPCRILPWGVDGHFLFKGGTSEAIGARAVENSALPRSWRSLPIVRREEAFDIVFCVETLEDGVRVRPGVELSVYDSPVLRLEAADCTPLPKAGRHVVRLTVPSGLLEPWDYYFSPIATVVLGDTGEGVPVQLPRAGRFGVLADGAAKQIRNAGAAGKSKVVLRQKAPAELGAIDGVFLKIVQVDCLDGDGRPLEKIESDVFKGPAAGIDGLTLAITAVVGGAGRLSGHVDLSAQTFGVLRCEMEGDPEVSSGQRHLLWTLPRSFRYESGYRLTVTLHLRQADSEDAVAEARTICHIGPTAGGAEESPIALVEGKAACRVEPALEPDKMDGVAAKMAGPGR